MMQPGNDSQIHTGNRKKGQKDTGKESGNRPKNTAERLRDAAVLNTAGAAGSHAVKMSLLLKLKIKLSQSKNLIFQITEKIMKYQRQIIN